ncbi:MAG: sigma-70 family RNA polymerase sigma factor [Candidatus Latescibacterota bacterium]|nr:MAG: sigma-70 family RNA polymerase sigma factor [Candidatus Latescibacterota bacterium]
MELQLNEMSDEDLVAASREGNKNAYATLVRRHAKKVYAVCVGILGNVTETEDIFQDTFVRGMTQIGSLRDARSFAAWIAQIARNLCRDHLRRQHRHRELIERQAEEPETGGGDFNELHEALAKLPEKYRLPLMLFYFDGKSADRLAEELEMTRAGACTRLFRARNELRKLLAKRDGTQ